MLKRTNWLATAVVAMVACLSAPAEAASIVPRPDQVLFGLPGTTVGWGYDITADPALDLLFLNSISADVPAASGSTISAGVFDYPSVPAGTTLHLDYDAILGSGLVQLTLSPLLSPGDSVTGRVFGSYVLHDPTGVLADSNQSFELFVTAKVPVSAAVPEPATLILLGTGLLAVVRRRRQTSA